MTADELASYSNFRYYSEMLSSGALSPADAASLMDFRETHGGTLSGMTRYTDHLDDMPAIGYAISSLAADRVERFLLLLHGHAANYQGRGSFLSNEQQSLYQDPVKPAWRQSLGDIQDSFCTPSQTLVASMTAMQFVSTERDTATIWLGRAVPRRWFAPDPSNSSVVTVGATAAPSRWGTVSFGVVPGTGAASPTMISLAVDFLQPKGAQAHPPTVRTVRLELCAHAWDLPGHGTTVPILDILGMTRANTGYPSMVIYIFDIYRYVIYGRVCGASGPFILTLPVPGRGRLSNTPGDGEGAACQRIHDNQLRKPCRGLGLQFCRL